MSKTVSVRLEHKSMSKAKIQRRHNERDGTQPKYVDSSKSHLNSVLIKAPLESELRDRCERLRSSKYKRKMKADAAILTDGIITFGTEAQKVINTLTPEKQDEYFLKMAQKVAEFAKTDLVSLVVHRDESAIHAHFGLLAVTHEGIPVSKSLKPKDMELLQDLAGDVFSDLGISRGEKKAARLARGDGADKVYHRSVNRLHQDLPKDIEALEEKIRKSQEKLEKNLSRIEQGQRKLDALRAQSDEYAEKIKKAEENLSLYEKRASNARKQLEEAQSQLDAIKHSLETVEPLQAIPEPPMEHHEVIVERGLLTEKTVVAEICNAADVKAYIRKVTEREASIMDTAMFLAFKKMKDLEKRETELAYREGQLELREQRLASKERRLADRESAVLAKEQQLGISKSPSHDRTI